MTLRPAPTIAGQWVRLLLTLWVVYAIVNVTWFIVEFDGEYTDGIPSNSPNPTHIYVGMVIDSEEEKIDVEITNFTSLWMYMKTREDTNESVVEDKEEENSKESEKTHYLDTARNVTAILMGGLVCCEIVMLAITRYWRWIRATFWTLILLSLLLLIPLAQIMDFSSGGTESFEGAEESQMAHSETDFGFELKWIGVGFSIETGGYDLGLVDEDNRTLVKESEPEEGKDAYSYIGFAGIFWIQAGMAVNYLLILPLVWIIFPSRRLQVIKLEAEVAESE